jgi:hypothetical protein
MTEETMPASTPAEATTQPAELTPATHYEQPAATPDHENYEDTEHEEPADLGEILEDRPKKLSGAQRAKLQRQHLENELRGRDERIAALERHINEENDRRRNDESERHAEAQRKRDEAHLERLKEAKGTITDFDRVMAKMQGATIHEDLLEDVLASDKSHLLAYHLAKNPDKLAELNQMGERARAREIGRLEASLKMPEGRKQTKAPPPPSNLKGGAAPHRALEQIDDMGTFSKRLLADLANRAGR